MTKKYNWELWFVRDRTILLRGVDYTCSQSSMCQSIRNAATKHGVRVGLTDTGDAIMIEVKGETSHPNTPPVAPQHEPPALEPAVASH